MLNETNSNPQNNTNFKNISHNMVAIAEGVHDIYKKLTTGNNPEEVPFSTMKDVFMWSVSLGFQLGERRPISGKRTEIFNKSVFNSQVDWPLLKAFAIAETEDVTVLQNHDYILNIAEELANAGISQLRASLLDEYGQPLWNLYSSLQ